MKRLLAPLFLVALAPSASAQSTDAFLSCAGIGDSLERLICYDEAVGKLRRAAIIGDTSIGRAAPAVAAPSVPRVVGPGSTSTDSTSGGSNAALQAPAVPLSIQSPEAYEAANSGTFGVAEARQFGNTILVLLDNGAVWRQIDGKEHRLPSGGTQTVEIVPGFQNSYFLSLSVDGAERIRQMRVRRVR